MFHILHFALRILCVCRKTINYPRTISINLLMKVWLAGNTTYKEHSILKAKWRMRNITAIREVEHTNLPLSNTHTHTNMLLKLGSVYIYYFIVKLKNGGYVVTWAWTQHVLPIFLLVVSSIISPTSSHIMLSVKEDSLTVHYILPCTGPYTHTLSQSQNHLLIHVRNSFNKTQNLKGLCINFYLPCVNVWNKQLSWEQFLMGRDGHLSSNNAFHSNSIL